MGVQLEELQMGLESHERPPLIGTLFVKLMIDAGYTDNDIRLAAMTMTSYVE